MKTVAITAALVAAFLAGLLLGRGRTAPPVAEKTCPAAIAPAAPVVARVDVAALRAEIRAAVREERPAAAAPAEPTPHPVAAADPAAADDARRIVTAARAARRWTQTDVLALRAVMPRLAPDEREEILSTLFPALNSGELRPDDDLGPPI
jgi:hypothetical protein